MTIIFFTLALALIIVVALFVRGTTRRVETLASVAELAVNVDIAALNRLLSPDDDRFLRERLPTSTYWHLRRRRDRLIFSYVRVMLHNTGIVMAFAATVRERPEPELNAAAAEVIYTAMQVRLRLAAVSVRIAFDWLFPFLPHSLLLLQPYRHLQDRSALLFRMLDPAQSDHAVAAL